jgi:hypothetical protein
MFTRALTHAGSSSKGREAGDASPAASTAAAAAASGSAGAASGHLTLSSKLQAMLLQHADDAADTSSNGGGSGADAVKVSPRGAAAANGAVRRVAFSTGGADVQKAMPAAGSEGDGDKTGVQDASAKSSVAAAAKLWGRLSPQ